MAFEPRRSVYLLLVTPKVSREETGENLAHKNLSLLRVLCKSQFPFILPQEKTVLQFSSFLLFLFSLPPPQIYLSTFLSSGDSGPEPLQTSTFMAGSYVHFCTFLSFPIRSSQPSTVPPICPCQYSKGCRYPLASLYSLVTSCFIFPTSVCHPHPTPSSVTHSGKNGYMTFDSPGTQQCPERVESENQALPNMLQRNIT